MGDSQSVDTSLAQGGLAEADLVRRGQLRRLVGQGAIWGVILLLFVISALVSPVFLQARNLTTILKQAAPLGILGVGQTLVILTGGIDLSVASVMALMSVVAANMMEGKDNLILPVGLLCLVLATLVGLFNGVVVTRLKIPAFITTLGTVLLVQGARWLYTGGIPRGSVPPTLQLWGRGMIGPVPGALIVWVVVVAVAVFIVRRTAFGRRLYAVGGNPRTAHLSGVNVNGTIIAAYVACGLTAGIAGLVLTGYAGSADNWLGRGYDLNSIAAVVVGGTAFEGGRGGLIGTIAGVLIITILFNLVLLLGLDEETQRIVKGIAIILAVALYARLRVRR
jgi:ribose/xylose/arabinose/galactoside ABC-type transport system permease subunit